MRDYPKISPVLRELVLSAPNGLPAKAVATLLERDYTTLLAEVAERSGHKVGVEMLLPIMEVTGSTLPLDTLAEAMGGFFVKMPAASTSSTKQIVAQCVVSVREFGEMMTAVASALEDGSISDAESKGIATKGYDAQTAIFALLRLVADTSGRRA